MIKQNDLQDIFGNYDFRVICKFINNFLPLPTSSEHFKYFYIRSIDNCSMTIWGINEEDIQKQFNRFLELRIFE